MQNRVKAVDRMIQASRSGFFFSDTFSTVSVQKMFGVRLTNQPDKWWAIVPHYCGPGTNNDIHFKNAGKRG
jgi:hypothetical protein